MIIEFFKQGSGLWHQSRLERPTASEFSRIVTGAGKRSEQFYDYAIELAGERLTGEYETFSSRWTKRGHEMEPKAIGTYQFATGNRPMSVGIVYRDEQRKYACSPDSLIVTPEFEIPEEDSGLVLVDPEGVVGGLECKALAPHNHIKCLIDEHVLPSKFFCQVQGSLWVTQLPWWDFISYHPSMRPMILRVRPDPTYHLALDHWMPQFLAQVEVYVKQAKGEDL